MGIKDLNTFLNDKMTLPRTRDTTLSIFYGRRIAIDAYICVHANMAIANKKVAEMTNVVEEELDRKEVIRIWIELFLDNVSMFIGYGITPVYVFDGVHVKEKSKTQDKRKLDKEKEKDEINKLRHLLGLLSPLDRDAKLVTRLRSLLSRSNYANLEEIKTLIDLFASLGIPILQASYEGEQLCSSLAREGLVSGVYPEDTDNLAYGCPVTITDLGPSFFDTSNNRPSRKISIVYLPDILDDLKWTQEELTDFCITLGCDFNQRIKGLGPVTAHKLINQYRSIDAYPSTYDLTCLNHQRCRDIFLHLKPVHVVDGEEVPVTEDLLAINKTTFSQTGEESLLEYEDNNYYARLSRGISLLSDPISEKLTFPRRRVITLPKLCRD